MDKYLKGFKIESLFKIYLDGFAAQESVLNNDFYIESLKRYISDPENLGLIISIQTKKTLGALITKIITGHRSFLEYQKGTVFPLYFYSIEDHLQILKPRANRTPNLNMDIVKQMAQKLELTFIPEKEPEGKVCYINNPEVRDDYKTTFAPIDFLDYIYAVLHSPSYRKKYKEFLKIDFPRVPYPKNTETFWQLVELGKQIREIHLLEETAIEKSTDAMPGISTYPVDGDNRVGKISFTPALEGQGKVGKVYINFEKASPSLAALQYFDNVPETAWNFYIGGYQPAQKWLKDRKGRTLTFEDILHYRKIIVALTETDRLMKEIDDIEIA